MKILLATTSVTGNSGVPSFNRELIKLLYRENEIHLLVNEKLETYIGCNKIYSTNKVNIFNYRDVFELLKKINNEDYDVIINSKSYIMSLMVSFLNNSVRVVTVSHSLGTMDCANAVFSNKYIDSVIALSKSCKDYICNHFRIESNKINVVFNSIVDNPNALSIRNEKMACNTIKIVFAGGAAPSKSPDIAIQVIKQLCKTTLPFKFYWLGGTTPPLKKIQPFDDIRKLLPQDDRIIVTGRLPQPQAAELIASCNIFFAPSRREGFPMALLEAMSVGCIPIVSDYKIANREIIHDCINGYVIPHKKIASFIERISDIIRNHGKYKNIYECSYRTFVDELSFPHWRKNMQSILSSTKITHSKRKHISRASFNLLVLRFRFLYIYNLIENCVMEVGPCAYRFYKYYRNVFNGGK